MNSRKLALAGAVAALTLLASSCHDDDDDKVNLGPQSLRDFAVNDINTRTADSALPIEINDLPLDSSNEDPAQYDNLLQSS